MDYNWISNKQQGITKGWLNGLCQLGLGITYEISNVNFFYSFFSDGL
jgi:hypothetical protein